MGKTLKRYRVLTLNDGSHAVTTVTAESKAGAKRAVGGRVVRVEDGEPIEPEKDPTISPKGTP